MYRKYPLPQIFMASKLVVGLMAVFTNILHISPKVTIYTYCYDCDVCYMQSNVMESTASCIDDRMANCSPHISTEHNRRNQKGLIVIKHTATKNSAKEEPQNCFKKNEG